MVGDVEEDGSVALFGAAADQLQRLLVPFEQRRQQLGDKGLASTSASGISVSSGISRGMKSGSCVASMISVSFIAGAAISTADSGLS